MCLTRLASGSFAVILVTFLQLLVSAPAGAVVYVDAAATGGNNGTSWSDAYTDLGGALAATGADEIWIARGTYRPAGPNGDRDASFVLKSGMALYGGFAGAETLREQRDPAANPTILSGDLNGNDPESGLDMGHILNFPTNDEQSENSRHVVTGVDLATGTRLDGLVITGGWGLGLGAAGQGAGLQLRNSHLTLANCVVRDNLAQFGGGLYSSGGSLVVENSTILHNLAYRGDGGGVHTSSAAGAITLTVSGSLFKYNNARQGHWGTGHGAGIYNGAGSALSVANSRFESNYSWHNNTYGKRTTGGAISNLGPALRVTHTQFISNYSNLGGAVYTLNGGEIVNALFDANRAVAASTCYSGECTDGIPEGTHGYGGAVYSSQGTLTLSSGTLSGNWAAKRAGGIATGVGATMVLNNSILWGNLLDQPCCGEDPIPLVKMQYNGNMQCRYSDVQGLFTAQSGWNPPKPSKHPGCRDADPRFVNANGYGRTAIPHADLRLAAGSLAIDAGNNSLVPAGVTTDLDGQPRLADDPASADTGLGTPPLVDLGAYEAAGTAGSLTLQSPGDQTSSEGAAVSLALSAYNPQGESLSFAATGLPAGLGIDTATGVINGTLAAGSAGTYSVTATATGGSAPSSATFTWVVNAPTTTPPPPTGGSVEMKGTIESVGDGFIVVSATTVWITADTAIQYEDSSGGQFIVGHAVELKGTRNSDGSVTASQMTVD